MLQMSDLHIEFGEYKFNCDITNVDVAVFNGDIGVGIKGAEWLIGLELGIPVIYILGNHEYYKKTHPSLIDKIRKLTKNTNVYLLENNSLTIDNTTFHGCTLWTDFNVFGIGSQIASMTKCGNVMNDYRLIKTLPNYRKLRPIDTLNIHSKSIKWLSESINNSSSKYNVVCTHHAPSLKSCLEHYKNDLTSGGYVSDLESFIMKHSINIWVHGHLHNSSDYYVGDTRVLCNPRGYVGHELNPQFNESHIIQLND